MFFDPYCLAFGAYPGLHPFGSPDTVLQVLLIVLYSLDICLNFFVAFYDDDGVLVSALPLIARRYCASGRLWLDLVTTIPFDWIVLAALGLQSSNSTLAWYVSMLRLLHLGRIYRITGWITFLTYNQAFSLFAVTLGRNLAVRGFVFVCLCVRLCARACACLRLGSSSPPS